MAKPQVVYPIFHPDGKATHFLPVLINILENILNSLQHGRLVYFRSSWCYQHSYMRNIDRETKIRYYYP